MAPTVLEQLAYGIARGVARAWFEEMSLRQQAEREVPEAPGDFDRARRLRDAVDRLRRSQGDTGPEHPTSGGV